MPTLEIRSFELREGTSDKFWSITLDGNSHAVRFGRRGTPGQEKTKSFGSESEARSAYDKLIEEKVGKGYRETGSAASAPAPAPATVSPKPVVAVAAAKSVKAPTMAAAKVAEPPMRQCESAGLHLDPEDWLFATWRPRVVRERPKAPAFSVEDGLKRYERFLSKGRDTRWSWESANMPAAMSVEEARFWVEMMVHFAEKSHKRLDYEPGVMEMPTRVDGHHMLRATETADVGRRISHSNAWGLAFGHHFGRSPASATATY